MTDFIASATLVSTERKRPPKQVLRMDITVDGGPRDGWLVVADCVRTDLDVSPRGIHTIDRYEIAPGCDLVWLKGDHGVLVLRVGPEPLIIRGLPVNRWSDANVVGIGVTRGITVDGKDLDGVFDGPIRRPNSEVDARALSAGAAIGQRLAGDFDHTFDVVVDEMITRAIELD